MEGSEELVTADEVAAESEESTAEEGSEEPGCSEKPVASEEFVASEVPGTELAEAEEGSEELHGEIVEDGIAPTFIEEAHRLGYTAREMANLSKEELALARSYPQRSGDGSYPGWYKRAVAPMDLPDRIGGKVKIWDIEPNFPWEKLPEENSKQFHGFRVYLEMGPTRTYQRVSRVTGFSAGAISNWSHKFNWNQRITAKEQHEVRLIERARIRSVVKMNERHAENAQKTLLAAMHSLARYIPTDGSEFTQVMEVKDAIRLLDIATKMERMARGEPETVEATVGQVDVTVTTVDERRAAMTKLLEAPKGAEHLSRITEILDGNGQGS